MECEKRKRKNIIEKKIKGSGSKNVPESLNNPWQFLFVLFEYYFFSRVSQISYFRTVPLLKRIIIAVLGVEPARRRPRFTWRNGVPSGGHRTAEQEEKTKIIIIIVIISFIIFWAATRVYHNVILRITSYTLLRLQRYTQSVRSCLFFVPFLWPRRPRRWSRERA